MTVHSLENSTVAEMTPRQRRRSMKYARIGAVTAVIGATCLGGLASGGNVMTLFALKLGATEMFLGLLSFAMLGTWVCSIFTMSAVEKYGKRNVLVFWMSISTLCIVPILFLPFLANYWSAGASLALLFAAIFIRGVTYALGSTGWFPLLQDIVPQRITGRFFGNVRTLWQMAGLITLLLIAWLLGKKAEFWKFEVVFVVAFIAYVIRVLSIIGIVEKPILHVTTRRFSILARFSEVLKDKQLCRLVLYISAYWIAATIAEPFKIKFLKDLGYSDGFILIAMAMVGLGAVVSLRFWGRLADKFGNRSIFNLSHIGMPVATVLWLFVGRYSFGSVLVLSLFFVWSIFNSGNGIAQVRCILHSVPADKQNQINILYAFANFATGVAPFAGGLFLGLTGNISFELAAKTFNNYHILFIISAVLFIFPHLLHRKLKLEEDTPTTEVVAFVTRPLRDMFGPFARIGK